jgi:hypothetical protein
MTVQELVSKLKKLPKDLTVVLRAEAIRNNDDYPLQEIGKVSTEDVLINGDEILYENGNEPNDCQTKARVAVLDIY